MRSRWSRSARPLAALFVAGSTSQVERPLALRLQRPETQEREIDGLRARMSFSSMSGVRVACDAPVRQQQLGERFDLVSGVYSKGFFATPEHAAAVRETYSAQTFNSEATNSLAERTRVLVPARLDGKDGSNLVQQHMAARIPVYFGAPRTDLFDVDSLDKVASGPLHSCLETLNRTTLEACSFGGLPLRYAVVGPAEVYTHLPAVSSTGSVFLRANGEVAVVHVWGVNLETESTPEFSYVTSVCPDGCPPHLDMEVFSAAQHEIIGLCVAAAKHVSAENKEAGGQGRVLLRLPKVGMGAFLSAVRADDEKTEAEDAFMTAVLEAVAFHVGDDIQVEVCSPMDKPAFMHAKLNRLANTAAYSTGGEADVWRQAAKKIRVAGDLFNLESVGLEVDVVLLVNAWDSHSFVGNGGRNDATVDGFMVSGLKFGAKLANSSFLHNPNLNPMLADASRWMSVAAHDSPVLRAGKALALAREQNERVMQLQMSATDVVLSERGLPQVPDMVPSNLQQSIEPSTCKECEAVDTSSLQTEGEALVRLLETV